MGLSGKLVSQISKKSDGDVFHKLFRYKPNHISDINPETVQSVDLQGGQWGTVGLVILWHYTQDGEKKVAKEITEAIDEKMKSITFKVIEGDLMELFKAFNFIVNVDTNGEDNLAVPDPRTLMDLGLSLTKAIERHHLLVTIEIILIGTSSPSQLCLQECSTIVM
ncbi:hypothetical protein Pfo_009800 [Paulownia fortunei]|nr:hypothetical protein Pfo_009800 [Paulownia fortunei]